MPDQSDPSPEAPRAQLFPRLLAASYLVVAVLSVALGGRWAVAELGSVPHYGDTREYLDLAQELEVDAYRGIGYPAFLAGLAQVTGETGLAQFPPWEEDGGPCVAPAGLTKVQIAQIALGILALFAALGWSARALGLGRAVVLGLVLVLATDPLVLHLETAVLTDAPALATGLVACTALARLATSGRLVVSALVFALAFVATALLRVEKTWVLMAAGVGTAAWFALRSSHRRRALVILGTTLACVALVVSIGRSFATDHGRWSVTESVLHQRVVFPHLSAIRGDLPRKWKRRIDRETAARYDEHIRFARREVDRLTLGQPKVRREMTEVLAREAWSSQRSAILRDVAADVAENVFATASFIARGVLFEAVGEERFRELVHTDGVAWTLTRATEHNPGPAREHLAFGLAAFVLALPCAFAGWRARRRRERLPEARDTLVPFVLFVAANAFAFALMADLVHIRYTVTAHVLALACLHGLALGWSFRTLRRVPAIA